MGVRRDEAGRHDAVGGVHLLVDAAVEPGPDVQDAVALEDDDAVVQHAVPAAVVGEDVRRADGDARCGGHVCSSR